MQWILSFFVGILAGTQNALAGGGSFITLGMLVLAGLDPRAARRPTVHHQAVAKVLAQLGKIGSNVNQLAHYAHLGRFQTNSIELALRDLAELRTACLHALGYEIGHEEESGQDDGPEP